MVSSTKGGGEGDGQRGAAESMPVNGHFAGGTLLKFNAAKAENCHIYLAMSFLLSLSLSLSGACHAPLTTCCGAARGKGCLVRALKVFKITQIDF